MPTKFIHRIKPLKLDKLHLRLLAGIITSLYLNWQLYIAIIIVKKDLEVAYSNAEIVALNDGDEQQPADEEAEVVKTGDNESATLIAKSGDTLSRMLNDAGLSPQDSASIITAMSEFYHASQLKIGQRLVINFKTDKSALEASEENTEPFYSIARSVKLHSDQEEIEVSYDGDKKSYSAQRFIIPIVQLKEYHIGQINESLYSDAVKAGVPAGIVADFIQKFSYNVDFQRDIKKGDKFTIYYEYTTNKDGKKIADGPLLYASLIAGNINKELYRYVTADGKVDYFNPKGESIKKALLLTPINGAIISSTYGMRKHPISGFSKKHEGLDYAAPRGTPIFSSGDGVVEEVKSTNKGYGRYVKIRHTLNYETLYGHMERFAKGMRKGLRVSQGDVIGYVGSSGNSTGPHLHYEVIERGKKINPAKISIPKMPPLHDNELKKFMEFIAQTKENISSNSKVG